MVRLREVVVNDGWQRNYAYVLSKREGKDFSPEFEPELTPKEMLELGVFGGVYFCDKPKELPAQWFKRARLTEDAKPNPMLNLFEISASQSLETWQKKGWIHPDDPRGWFQWYSRYYLGRRLEVEDQRQIRRWKAMKRHVAQIRNSCPKSDLSCRRKQRQALLHWAYDSRKF